MRQVGTFLRNAPSRIGRRLLVRNVEHLLDLLLGELRRLIPQATWTAAGIGRHQARVMEWALARGADAVRTGLEDNIRVEKERLASSNAELVELAVLARERQGRRAAKPHALLNRASPGSSGGIDLNCGS